MTMLAEAVNARWAAHQYAVTGDYGEINVFDRTPDFVTHAQSILGEAEGKKAMLSRLQAIQSEIEALQDMQDCLLGLLTTAAMAEWREAHLTEPRVRLDSHKE